MSLMDQPKLIIPTQLKLKLQLIYNKSNRKKTHNKEQASVFENLITSPKTCIPSHLLRSASFDKNWGAHTKISVPILSYSTLRRF